MSAPEVAPQHGLWDLENLAGATRLCDWMFAQYAAAVTGNVVEVGAGIGTFSSRILSVNPASLLLLDTEPACVEELERRLGDRPNVTVVQEALPEAPSLRALAGEVDLIVCQNVLEHIADDREAVAAMARALRPEGGQLTLIVPAHPRLFGSLDRRYGHERRYTRAALDRLVFDAGLRVIDLYSFNLLGIAGWIAKSRSSDSSIGVGSLRAYEAMVRLWRPIEDRLNLPWGLSLIVHAQRP